MNRRAAFLGIAFAFSLRAEPGSAASLPPDTARRIDAVVRSDMRTARTPGVSLAIVRDDEIVYVKGFGYKDLARREVVDPQTVFRFGSVSKQFTAVALLQLEQRGKVSLRAPVLTWFRWATDASDVRLVDLLSQVSGYRDYYPLDYVDLEMSRPTSVPQIVAKYGRLPLTAPSRSRWEYSNTNFTVAGRIAEKVSGLGLDALLRKGVFGPLQMTRTFVDEPARAVPDRATGYNSYFTEPQHEDAAEAPDWLNAAAGLAGTAADLARFDIGLMTGSLLDARSTRSMTTERVLMPGSVHTHYGLGVTSRVVNGHRIVSHGGNVIGFASENVMAFDDRTAVVVLTNSYEAPAPSIAQHVLNVLMPVLAKKPAKSKSGAPRARVSASGQAQLRGISRGLAALRAGTVPRSLFDDEFLAFMTATNVGSARSALAGLGSVKGITFLETYPRGGLVVTDAMVTFARGTREVLSYAEPSGRMAELFLFVP